jgi:hypothetical protein
MEPQNFQQETVHPEDPINALLSEFSTRLNELEEKQRLIKDRVLLIGENLISTKEESISHDFQTRKKLKEMDSEIKSMKQALSRLIGALPEFARKSELAILERQMKMFQPLELARIKDVKEIVKEEIEKLNINQPGV